MILEELKKKNKELKFLKAKDESTLFKKVEIKYDDLILLSAKLNITDENNYIANDTGALLLHSVKETEKEIFGELPIQAGWCFGKNIYMNGMEWHKTSEVVVACTDCVLLIGSYLDVINDTYISSKASALYLEKGEAVELLPMTLHLAPLPVQDVFKVGIILPKGTNLALSCGINGAKRAVNKWLLLHKDNLKGIKNGGKVGVIGSNIFLKR
jgi:hypothetical protein